MSLYYQLINVPFQQWFHDFLKEKLSEYNQRQFLRVGQEENDEENKTNKWFLENLFITEVTKYYRIEDSNINLDKTDW